jgi:tRNA(fMet)-specific endonuclease VapC
LTRFAGICLDTEVCIDLMRGVRTLEEIRYADVPRSALWVSTITLSELGYGVRRSRKPDEERARLAWLLEVVGVRDFDARAAELSGVIRARLEQQGARIGALDTLIGSHALAEGAMLMTRNVREFSRIPGLAIAEL